MTSFSFTVPGAPQGKGRPRFTRKGIPYTPPATRAAEKRVRACYVEASGPRFPDDVAIAMALDVRVARPTSHSLVGGDLSKRGRGHPLPIGRGTVDVDNVAKLVLDALEGVAFRNDAQVTILVVERSWAILRQRPHDLDDNYDLDEWLPGVTVTLAEQRG